MDIYHDRIHTERLYQSIRPPKTHLRRFHNTSPSRQTESDASESPTTPRKEYARRIEQYQSPRRITGSFSTSGVARPSDDPRFFEEMKRWRAPKEFPIGHKHAQPMSYNKAVRFDTSLAIQSTKLEEDILRLQIDGASAKKGINDSMSKVVRSMRRWQMSRDQLEKDGIRTSAYP